MSEKYILNSADKTLSPSQVYLEKISSGVFKDMFSTGCSSYNDILQWEEEKKSPTRSLCKTPKTKVKCGAPFSERSRLVMALKNMRAIEGGSKPALTDRVLSGSSSNFPKPPRNMAVVGSTMGLISHTIPQLREMCIPISPHTKLPSLHKAAITQEVENAKKLCVLTAIKPFNVEREKAKFFSSPTSTTIHSLSTPTLSLHLSWRGIILPQIVF